MQKNNTKKQNSSKWFKNVQNGKKIVYNGLKLRKIEQNGPK